MVDVLFYPWCGGLSGVVDVWCGGYPVWWTSGVVDVLFYPYCGGCLVWWMSVWWMSYNLWGVYSEVLRALVEES